MNILLTAEETRVLGCLLEKEVTTPAYYPITLNALVNACNQKSCREPVVSYDDTTVTRALDLLREKQLTCMFSGSDSRVVKHKQRLTETFFFTPQERALLCELMLRGPQTPGELRTRAERMQKFNDLAEVDATLRELATRQDGPWVVSLPRQPGRKEQRYIHLLNGQPDLSSEPVVLPTANEAGPTFDERVAVLEKDVAYLKGELMRLMEKLGETPTRGGETEDHGPAPEAAAPVGNQPDEAAISQS